MDNRLNKMEIIKMRVADNDYAELRLLADGGWICPICGSIFYGQAPYGMDVNSGQWTGSWQTCPHCGIEYGAMDLMPNDAPLGTMEAVWKEIRIEWLRRIEWAREDLDRLHDNLGIDVDALKKAATRTPQ